MVFMCDWLFFIGGSVKKTTNMYLKISQKQLEG